jgi:hypothetical protein
MCEHRGVLCSLWRRMDVRMDGRMDGNAKPWHTFFFQRSDETHIINGRERIYAYLGIDNSPTTEPGQPTAIDNHVPRAYNNNAFGVEKKPLKLSHIKIAHLSLVDY